MGKPSKARRSAESAKRKGVKFAPETVDNDDGGGGGDEEVLSPDEENVISASEDEEGSDEERRHSKLLEAISSLGGKRRKKQAERSEASIQVSEFSVTAEGAGEKVNLSDLLGTMEKTAGAPKKTKKQLRNLQNRKDTLELPLSKQETEKIQRAVAYEKSTKEVSQWESVINQAQKAEQLVFPLKQEPLRPKRMEQVVSGWKAQTPLEQEILSLLHRNQQPFHDPVLTPMEEASISAMSLEEAKIRRAELQKARALQSYYEAKAKRERKIKSRKYHKVQKKAKRKQFLKQFDEMMKTDPNAALEELKKMEQARMEERMSLKHQNSGKWAKSRAIMAKYDESARKAMQEQLQINKDLTQKLAAPPNEDDEEEKDEEEDVLPDFVNEAELPGVSVNPWMRGKLSTEASVPEVTTGPPEAAETTVMREGTNGQEEEEEDDEEENEEEQLLREFERKRKAWKEEEDDVLPGAQEEKEKDTAGPVAREEVVGEDVVEISDDEDQEEEEEEEEKEEVVSEFNSLFNRLMKSGTAPAEEQSRAEEAGLLDEGLERAQTMEDLDALVEVVEVEPREPTPVEATPTQSVEATSKQHSKKKKKEIDPNKVLTKEAKAVRVPLVPTVVENEEEEEHHVEQMSIIKEAFAGDDVISDFLKDKKKQEAEGQPKVVDLTLPGWGEWGGIGLKPSRKKRRKFRLKVAPAPPRKDQKLPAVIMSEKRNASIAAHQVSQLPFPFQNSVQFESSIRFPIGQTWNTQTTVKKLTAPKVVTKLGAIIDPINKEDFIPNKKGRLAEKNGEIFLGESVEKEEKKELAGKGRASKSQHRTKKKGKE